VKAKTDDIVLAEGYWRYMARRNFGGQTYSKTEAKAWVAKMLSEVNRRYIYTAQDVKMANVIYGPVAEAAFVRLVAAGVIHYQPRRPLAPGLVP
jgi:hypothetical protein